MKRSQVFNLLPLVAVAALFFVLGGCEDDPTDPNPGDGAPNLPNPEQLQIDLSFFDQAEPHMAKAVGDNFIQAYLRVTVINLMLQYYLTPPVAAFALALHTVPSPQEDGSWIWVYTYVDGEDELQVRLRGTPVGDNVAWELRVNAPGAVPPLDDELWFEGETRNEGQFGEWTFYDFTIEGKPAVSTVEWGDNINGEYLVITALHGEDEGDVLTFEHYVPENSIDYHDASADQNWYIRWNEDTGTGSLMVPDYNHGIPACWDENQDDTECDPLEFAPTLPDAELLQVDLSFFAEYNEQGAKALGDNFFNAYLRVVVIDLMLNYYLTPPVAAFALALHTVPSPQEDGSWIWVYTFVDGEEELQIRLRGLPVGDNVAWELRVNAPDAVPPLENVLWFEGATRNEGQFGEWTFYDFTIDGEPEVSTVEWGDSLDGEYLTITALYGEDEGDVLNFNHNAPENSIEYEDASTGDDWFIHWNTATGTGSLMVPDYNEGLEACWDVDQNDIECGL